MQETVEQVISAYLQEKGYTSYVPEEFIAELATRIIQALDQK